MFARKLARTTLAPEGDGLNLAVVPDEVGRVIGDMTLFWRSEVHRQGEIGFIFHPDFQGRGYAREASEAVLRIGVRGCRAAPGRRPAGRRGTRRRPGC